MTDRKRKRPLVAQAEEEPIAPDEQGFVYAVARWPAPWPPAELTGYLDSPVKGGRLQMLATAQGNLVLILLNRDGAAIHQFTSQPIAVLNLGYKVVKLMWTIEGLSVVLGTPPVSWAFHRLEISHVVGDDRGRAARHGHLRDHVVVRVAK